MTFGAKNKNTEQTVITEKTENLGRWRSFGYFRLYRCLPISCLCLALCVTANAQKAQATEDGAKLKLGNRTLLENTKDGFLSVRFVRDSPDGKRFVVVACGFECNDNIGFLFNADGSGKRKFTARWDFILQDKVEWSVDGKTLFYFSVHSTGAAPPPKALSSRWLELDIATGQKRPAVSRRLKPESTYAVFRIKPFQYLDLHEAANPKSKILASLRYNAKSVKVSGECRSYGKDIWVKITHDGATGWVNQNFLYETPKDQ